MIVILTPSQLLCKAALRWARNHTSQNLIHLLRVGRGSNVEGDINAPRPAICSPERRSMAGARVEGQGSCKVITQTLGLFGCSHREAAIRSWLGAVALTERPPGS